ncbi:DnaA inactivator Hda (shorter homolog of DnaA) [hydrothermal vent metagenome]|uniref:DnaA inactivator Hda (Shorter homolog of DnaA) n=1 Tax=hydrothermal vent metagenome TaxID=652676 RepID=A0A3B1AUJ7_9ZZZZ
MQQLPLGISLKPDISFAGFIASRNQQAVDSLQEGTKCGGTSFIFLWGNSGTGKTHLLHAACRLADTQNQPSIYIPLSQALEFSPDIFTDLDKFQLVCLDDVEQITRQQDWEQALFNLFNQVRDKGTNLFITSDCSPTALDITLPDLASRLGWGLNYRLHPLTDDEKVEALQKTAQERGMTLPDECVHYMLKHCPRDMGTLLEILAQLDQASLAAQRKLTIPFIHSQIAEFIATRRLQTQA